MVKHRWLFWAIQMCHYIIPDVNVATGLSVIIDSGMISPGHGIEVLDGINAIGKRFIFQLMSTMQLTGAKSYDTQMVMHTETCTSDVSLTI